MDKNQLHYRNVECTDIIYKDNLSEEFIIITSHYIGLL